MTMAGYSIDTGINPDEQAEEPQKRRKRAPILPQEPDFIQALCTVYAQKEKELSFRLQRTGLHVRGAKTAPLPLFCVSPDYEPPATVKGILRADLHLPGGTRAKNLDITKRSVQFDFTTLENTQDRMHTAFAMAMAAMANKDLRKNGVRINGTEEEQLFLLIAARKVGLKVADVDPKLEEQATNYLKGTAKLDGTAKVSALWSDFLAHKPAPAAAAPDAADEEETAAPQPATAETEPEEPATDDDEEQEIPPYLKAYLAEEAARKATEAAAGPVAAQPVITPPPAQEPPAEPVTGEILPAEKETEAEPPVIEGEIIPPEETAAPQPSAAEAKPAKTDLDDDEKIQLQLFLDNLLSEVEDTENNAGDAAATPATTEEEPDDELAAALAAVEEDVAKMIAATMPPDITPPASKMDSAEFSTLPWEEKAQTTGIPNRERPLTLQEIANRELPPSLRLNLLAATEMEQMQQTGKIPLKMPDLTKIWNEKSGPEQVAFLKNYNLLHVLVEAGREGIHPDLARVVAREFSPDHPDITHEELSELWNELSTEVRQDVLDESGLTYIGEDGRAKHMKKVEEVCAQAQQAIQKIRQDSGHADQSFDQVFESRQIRTPAPPLKMAPLIK